MYASSSYFRAILQQQRRSTDSLFILSHVLINSHIFMLRDQSVHTKFRLVAFLIHSSRTMTHDKIWRVHITYRDLYIFSAFCRQKTLRLPLITKIYTICVGNMRTLCQLQFYLCGSYFYQYCETKTLLPAMQE